ncbi:Uncharacterized protein C19orf47 [Harpegnathos saltator]|uniref:Uncharacterized protein C19orf47 n=1 Tax=Harpegnathos saltator TaxID=610380 RepID=E2C445_HARSA|nr:Uncharacterized protein C19orf47 [Harpegnathos saltator]
MAASLSAYWVKFFKGAGFPQDLATKHALVFSNNRIKPDMLPDLDKSSLKDMGITLMGDMIAILRYAKKVVEETTCERFLVDSEDTLSAPKNLSAQPVHLKKIVKEVGKKIVISPTTVKAEEPVKKVQIKPLSTTKKIITIKKPISAPNVTNTEYVSQKKQLPVKRKLVSDEAYESNEEDNWNITEKKKVKMSINNNEDSAEYKVVPSKTSSVRVQQIHKPMEQKRTVFDRLGDSSVTSTTNLVDTSPTFNITGINKDVFKKSVSVFKRLGEIDDKKDYVVTAGILKNGSSNTISSPGILKNKIPDARTSIITTKRIATKTTGTMHADHEVGKKTILNNTKRILKVERKLISPPDTTLSDKRITKITMSPGKLGMYAEDFVEIMGNGFQLKDSVESL